MAFWCCFYSTVLLYRHYKLGSVKAIEYNRPGRRSCKVEKTTTEKDNRGIQGKTHNTDGAMSDCHALSVLCFTTVTQQ